MSERKVPEPIFDSEAERADFAFHDSDEWVSVENDVKQRAALQEVARRKLAGGGIERISLAIPEADLARLKALAAKKGMPYQTLINSILHEYVEG